jgi:uncharacterized peroxidase-related enzyme
MTEFTLHTADTAPTDAQPLLEKSVATFGLIPNLHAVMAESPELLNAYQSVHALFQESSLKNDERNVVWMAVNVQNKCHYCVPAHSMIAKMQGLDDETISALRHNAPLSDPRLEAIRRFTLAIVRQDGVLSESEVKDFLNAGFSKRNILDVILGVAQKTMSNYTNHFAQTPIDAMFADQVWTPAEIQAAE